MLHLPTELLSIIFCFDALLFGIDRDQYWVEHYVLKPILPITKYDIRRAVTLSGVCRLWRDVALESGALWSSPILTIIRSPLDFVMVDRAKAIPVDIFMNLDQRYNRGLTNHIVSLSNRMHNVAHLTIAGNIRYIRLLLENATCLRSLAISRCTKEFIDSTTPFCVPQLVTLILDCVSIEVPAALLTNLRRLVFLFQEASPWDLDNIVNTLGHTSSLQELGVHVGVRTEDIWEDTGAIPAHFLSIWPIPQTPELRRLSLQGDPSIAFALFRHLDVSAADLQCEIIEEKDCDEDYTLDFDASFRKQIHLDPDFAPTGIHARDGIFLNGCYQVSITFAANDNGRVITYKKRSPSQEACVKRVTEFLAAIIWTSVQEIKVSLLNGEEWVGVSSTMAIIGLSHNVVAIEGGSQAISAMLATMSRTSRQQNLTVLDVTLVGSSLRSLEEALNSGHGEVEEAIDEPMEDIHARLRLYLLEQVARGRAEERSRLRSITFRDCDFLDDCRDEVEGRLAPWVDNLHIKDSRSH